MCVIVLLGRTKNRQKSRPGFHTDLPFGFNRDKWYRLDKKIDYVTDTLSNANIIIDKTYDRYKVAILRI